MKTTPLLIILNITLLLTFGCSKVEAPTEESKLLFGEWEWKRSSGGMNPQTITPESEGYTLRIEFKKNGTFKKFKNNNKVSKMKFFFELGESIYSGNQEYLINYKDGMSKKAIISQSFRFSGNDTLYLLNECYDCYVETYIRKK